MIETKFKKLKARNEWGNAENFRRTPSRQMEKGIDNARKFDYYEPV